MVNHTHPEKIVYIVMLTIFLSSCDTLRKLGADKVSLNGRYVSYDCQPIKNTEIYSYSTLSKGGYLHSGTSSTDSDITDQYGNFNLDLYVGKSAIVSADEKYSSSLQRFSNADLIWLEAHATNNNYVAFYKQTKFKDYTLSSYREWIKKPLYYPTSTFNTPILEEKFLYAKDFIRSNTTGHRRAVDKHQLIISIKSINDKTDNGWNVIIEGNKDGGLILIDESKKPISGYIPVDGYTNKINVFLPNTGYPYEMNDKWKHHVFYLKADNGNIYGIMSLDIAFVSPYDKDNYKKLKPDPISHGKNYPAPHQKNKSLAIWVNADFIYSSKTKTEDISEVSYYRQLKTTRLPIEKPYIPQKKCDGILQDAYNGYLGHHPPPDKFYIRQRNNFIQSTKKN